MDAAVCTLARTLLMCIECIIVIGSYYNGLQLPHLCHCYNGCVVRMATRE